MASNPAPSQFSWAFRGSLIIDGVVASHAPGRGGGALCDPRKVGERCPEAFRALGTPGASSWARR